MAFAEDVALKPMNWVLPLNNDFYSLDEEEKAFFQKESGIVDDNELKDHIIAVQAKAFSVFPYPCIRGFEFARLKLARLPAYNDLLKLGKERESAIFIDFACCFGNDVRKAVQDGYPVQNAIAADLRESLWDLGHELFRSTPETFPVPFVQGDIFDPSFLEAMVPVTKDSPATTPVPSLRTIVSFNPIRGHVSAVYVGAFFHLFSEEEQERIARALAGLLSPEPGSMLLGCHGGMVKKGYWKPTGLDYKMFGHSPESWKSMWEGLFGKGNIEVKAELETWGGEFLDYFPGNKEAFQMMNWSVTRL
ncbi:hypothetical protein B0H34DRAFT_719962 [Crassisporium funariophilum]|nr:hypothetical protein B0H34DRAFT_719962 [Crassisporium funariophilum]